MAEAARVLAEEPDVKAIAGGTALLVLMKQGVFLPERLVNLRKIREASYVAFDPVGGLRLGALTPIADVESHPTVRRHYPVLADAAHKVANIRIRHLATIGGNVAHADAQSDPPAVLVGLGARVVTLGRSGERVIPLAEFLKSAYETALEPGELVREIQVPPPAPDEVGAYLKFVTRTAGDRPCVGVAAFARCQRGAVESVRVVVGAVNPVPVRMIASEQFLRGRRVDEAVVAEAARLTADAVDPIDDDLRGSQWYKRQVVPVIVRRALEQVLNLAARTGEGA
jgi:carbon-monoxide dehydrogenase medium subunit